MAWRLAGAFEPFDRLRMSGRRGRLLRTYKA
jgi:hypothetical protein